MAYWEWPSRGGASIAVGASDEGDDLYETEDQHSDKETETYPGNVDTDDDDDDDDDFDSVPPFQRLASLLQDRLEGSYSVADIERSLKSLAGAQKTLKGLDGAAHEAYQRTRRSSSKSSRPTSGDKITSVSGRAKRSAARAASTADALMSSELCEYLADTSLGDEEDGPLQFREVVVNATVVPMTKQDSVSFVVLWEPHYNGGAGLEHGSIDDMLRESDNPNQGGDRHEVDGDAESERQKGTGRGRLIVIVKDSIGSDNIEKAVDILDEEPLEIELKAGLVASEFASVQATLYKTAGRLLQRVEDVLTTDDRWNDRNDTDISDAAIHFVGRSLGGGVAGLAAAILDGTLPMPSSKRKKRRAGTKNKRSKASSTSTKEKNKKDNDNDNDSTDNTKRRRHRDAKSGQNINRATSGDSRKDSEGSLSSTTGDGHGKETVTLEGYGRGRSSAMLLGPPPCLSTNVKAAFIKSIIFGDDVICRTTSESFERLLRRTERGLKGGVLARQMNWMTGTLSLTVSRLETEQTPGS